MWRKAVLLLFLFPMYLVAETSEEPDPCEEEIESIIAPTVEKCESGLKIYSGEKYKKCFTTVWTHNLSTAKWSCYKGAMETEVDKRLLMIKAKDKRQFESEMALQAEFNRSIKSLCSDRATECCDGGSMVPEVINNCHSTFYDWRFEIARQTNQAELNFPRKKAKTQPLVLKRFIEKLCALPKEVWREKVIPKDCVERVYADLEVKKLWRSPGKN